MMNESLFVSIVNNGIQIIGLNEVREIETKIIYELVSYKLKLNNVKWNRSSPDILSF